MKIPFAGWRFKTLQGQRLNSFVQKNRKTTDARFSSTFSALVIQSPIMVSENKIIIRRKRNFAGKIEDLPLSRKS